VASQIKKGKKVFVWTVNSEADLQLCEKLGVNAVMSDNPALARNLLGYS
jgi:glycerophosphoryl diester phosphodiesterase